MGNYDQAYLVQRAAEEMAAAERSTCAAAACVHRELALRYSLKLILPQPTTAPDETQPVGQPGRLRQIEATVAPRTRATKRRRAAHAGT